MKILKMVVTDENGVETTYEGEGFVSPIRTQSATKPGKPEPVQIGVDAHLVWNE